MQTRAAAKTVPTKSTVEKGYELRQKHPQWTGSDILAEGVPGSWSVFRGISQEKATGLAAVAGGARRERLFALILDSRGYVLRIVFCGQ
jgi:hypothetical protein